MAFLSVTPYLRYPDADAAAEWLSRAFGFGPAQCVRNAEGRWTEGTLQVGAGRVDLSGSGAADRALLIIGVDDVDDLYRRITEAGVDIDSPRDEPYGPRSCHVTDPWGYQWYFWQGDARYD